MIQGLHHLAIIVSGELSIGFYEKLGFKEFRRIHRSYDTVVLMKGFGIELEMFIDPNHGKRASDPENMGLRHLALKVDNIRDMATRFECGPIMQDWTGMDFCFTSDPDGLPIEFHE